MSPKDLVLQGYKLFSEGKIEELGKQWHQDAKIHVTGDYAWSGTYNGYNDWVARMLSQIPEKLPKELQHVLDKDENFQVLKNNTEDVKNFVKSKV